MEQRRSAEESDDPQDGPQEIIRQALQAFPFTENGQETIRPDGMAFIMQAAAAAQLVKLRKLEESKIPVGSFSVGLTVSIKTQIRLSEPLISFSMINDGPNTVFIEVSLGESEIPIPRTAGVLNGETFTYNATYPVIKTIVLDVDAGNTAAIRIKGLKGLWPI